MNNMLGIERYGNVAFDLGTVNTKVGIRGAVMLDPAPKKLSRALITVPGEQINPAKDLIDDRHPESSLAAELLNGEEVMEVPQALLIPSFIAFDGSDKSTVWQIGEFAK